MNKKKLLAKLLLLVSVSIIVYVIISIGLDQRDSTTQNLEVIWKTDIQNLIEAKKIPALWQQIKIIEKVAGNDDTVAAGWAKTVSVPVDINSNGKYKLEILYLSQVEKDVTRAVIQHHVTYIPTGDSIWELSRTYTINLK